LSILQEILEWSQGIPAWQSDAITRLLSKPELSADDLGDLFALLKTEHGIADPDGRTPNKLTAAQIPAPPNANTHVELLAVKNLRHVNAIAENQRLAFGASGLSVVYGHNGSGKSGYSRVLKRACRARDQTETIHPNANLPAGGAGAAEAVFEVTVNGAAQDVAWADGTEAPPELSTLSIFDSRCAHAYLDNEDDFSYVPYGLDVFERLGQACQHLKGRIDAEVKQSAVDLTVFASLAGDTAVGKLIAALSDKTKPTDIEALATLSEAETAEHAKLAKSLKENDPKEKAGQLRLRARRIATVASTAKEKGGWVNTAAITKLRELADAYRKAKAAAALAAQKFNEGEDLLPGTGGDAWRVLFEAARKFAEESHPDQAFPQLEADAPCPLCQEPLNEGAERLKRFEAFIKAEAEKAADAAKAALNDEYQPFIKRDLTLNLDDVTHGEIEGINEALAADTRTFETAIAERHKAIQDALKSNEWGGLDQPITNPSERLQKLADKLNAEAEALDKAADEKKRAVLQKQFDELDARMALAKVKASVLTAVSKLVHAAKLTKCLASVRTNAISLKASDLAAKVVSKDLADALNAEFKKLGVGSLQVTLKSRSDRGRAIHKLKLELPQTHSPREILSEGEQRAIAIGSFLAEVGLSGGKGGIVFDDPMSSLDHRRRERVARRLVAEAAQRQVIVFTHDIYFLCLLAEETQAAGVALATQSIIGRNQSFGVTDPDLPFEGRNTKARIGALKAQQQLVAKLHKDGDEEEHRKQTVDAYFHLRMAWERAVEEVLLRSVVLRFRKGIETQRLAEVVVEDADHAQVYGGMAKCSNYAHDKAMAGGVAVPEPDELLADIQELETWRSSIEKRSQDTRKRRKK
jgi:energy-coupling factor transporter ATP-binding protein EcfA2